MSDPNAAGRKTDKPQPLARGYIETELAQQLALMTEGMREAFDRARSAEDDPSILHNPRSGEIQNAIALARTSAKVVQAMAKLNGRFHHDINVRRDPPPPPES